MSYGDASGILGFRRVKGCEMFVPNEGVIMPRRAKKKTKDKVRKLMEKRLRSRKITDMELEEAEA